MTTQGPIEISESFLMGAIDPTTFHHRDHIAVYWSLLNVYGTPRSRDLFREGLRRFADKIGKPELYHETLTTAWMILIEHDWRTQDHWSSFAEFVAENPTLVDRLLIERYYSKERLEDPLARETWIEPDQENLPQPSPWPIESR